jgi:hypothetical protein
VKVIAMPGAMFYHFARQSQRRPGIRPGLASKKIGGTDFTVKNQIPLNPPLIKGDFKTPL